MMGVVWEVRSNNKRESMETAGKEERGSDYKWGEVAGMIINGSE